MKGLIGTKVGMTSVIADDGSVTPVTLIQAGPVTVTQVKTDESDGYAAVQVAYGRRKNPAKTQTGHLKSAKLDSAKSLREFNTSDELSVGDVFDVNLFSVGQAVKVTGTSKGKGFTGTIKRHNFSRQRKTHGGKGHTRRPGSIGSMYPQKIFKGKKMAGRSGAAASTVRNLKVALVDPENHLIGVKGAVPGPKRGLVTVEAI